jgi:hypothetical protein
MNSRVVISAVVLFLFSPLPPLNARQGHGTIAITHANVIPMTSKTILPDQTVLVSGSRIVSVGPAHEAHFARGTHTIDARGRYLLPGLIDVHVHLYAPQQLPIYVANGITTVFNLNGKPLHLVWRDEIAKGRRLGPRIYSVAPKFERADPPEKAVAMVDEY